MGRREDDDLFGDDYDDDFLFKEDSDGDLFGDETDLEKTNESLREAGGIIKKQQLEMSEAVNILKQYGKKTDEKISIIASELQNDIAKLSTPKKVTRDVDGNIVAVGNKEIKRDSEGLIYEI